MIDRASLWRQLSDTLTERRLLEAAQRPIENIGCKASPGSSESYESFKQRIGKHRAEAREDRSRMCKKYKVRTFHGLTPVVEKLKRLEAKLWAQCRPDIYNEKELLKEAGLS